MNFDHKIRYFVLNDLQKYYSFENSSKVQITASVIFEGGGPKFKGLFRRQDMIFVDIIIIGDEAELR